MRAEQPAVGFISLGCPKALVDSERILTQINADGYAITDRTKLREQVERYHPRNRRVRS